LYEVLHQNANCLMFCSDKEIYEQSASKKNKTYINYFRLQVIHLAYPIVDIPMSLEPIN